MQLYPQSIYNCHLHKACAAASIQCVWWQMTACTLRRRTAASYPGTHVTFDWETSTFNNQHATLSQQLNAFKQQTGSHVMTNASQKREAMKRHQNYNDTSKTDLDGMNIFREIYGMIA